MDLSKLPRLSETNKQAPPAPESRAERSEAAPPRPIQYRSREAATAGVGAQVWLSLAIGVILMMLGANFARWSIAKLSGQPYHTNVNWVAGPKAGQEVEYFELQGFTAWTEMGIFIFGVAMVLEAAMLTAVHRRLGGQQTLTAIALLVTVLATLLNLYVCIKLFGAGIMPLMSAMAVAFGGYMAVYEWTLLQQLRPVSEKISPERGENARGSGG